MTYRRTAEARKAAIERRSEIIAATGIAIADTGIADASMKQVAMLAGCSVGTLYTHFGSRDQLLYEAFMHFSQREFDVIGRLAVSCTEPTPGQRAAHLADTFVRRALANPNMASAIMYRPATPAVESARRTCHATFADFFATALAGQPPRQEERVLGRAIVGSIYVIMQEPLYDAPAAFTDAERDAFSAQFTELCLRATGEA